MAEPTMQHLFVDEIPSELSAGILYVSVLYKTGAHLCPCGCRWRVSTPLSRTQWSITFDGETISMAPSIGNYSQPCRSHYWIWHDEVRWVRHESSLTRQLSQRGAADRPIGADQARDVPAARRWRIGRSPR